MKTAGEGDVRNRLVLCGQHELSLVDSDQFDIFPERHVGNLFEIGAEIGPVSYTHLDVYKRQGQICPCVCSVRS